MTTPRIEEIKAEFQMFVPEDDGSAMDWLENTLAEVKKEALDEEAVAIERMKRLTAAGDEQYNSLEYEFDCGYNKAIDDTIKALKDNK